MKGIIVSLKNAQTVVVRVEKVYRHPRYTKIIRRHKNLHAGLASDFKVSQLKLGQSVGVVPARPQSSQKRFLLVKVYG